MTRKRRLHTTEIAATCFVAGVITGWWLHVGPPAPALRRQPGATSVSEPAPTATIGAGSSVHPHPDTAAPGEAPLSSAFSAPPATAPLTAAVDELRRRNLRLPLDGIDAEAFKRGFSERRGGGNGRQHEAADMMAARNTPIHAVDHGSIAKLFASKDGGLTIYQLDQSGRFCYYYAHLERYAFGLDEGQRVLRGEVLGYVGTSGNARPGAPHLHFAISVLGPDRKWWQGEPIDPYLVFRK